MVVEHEILLFCCCQCSKLSLGIIALKFSGIFISLFIYSFIYFFVYLFSGQENKMVTNAMLSRIKTN